MDHGFAATGPHLSPDMINDTSIVGDWITAVRPSGTEDVNQRYAERFSASEPLRQLQEEAQPIIRRAIGVGASR